MKKQIKQRILNIVKESDLTNKEKNMIAKKIHEMSYDQTVSYLLKIVQENAKRGWLAGGAAAYNALDKELGINQEPKPVKGGPEQYRGTDQFKQKLKQQANYDIAQSKKEDIEETDELSLESINENFSASGQDLSDIKTVLKIIKESDLSNHNKNMLAKEILHEIVTRKTLMSLLGFVVFSPGLWAIYKAFRYALSDCQQKCAKNSLGGFAFNTKSHQACTSMCYIQNCIKEIEFWKKAKTMCNKSEDPEKCTNKCDEKIRKLMEKKDKLERWNREASS